MKCSSVCLFVLSVLLGACQAPAPGTAGPAVSGESHFLAPCAQGQACVDGLVCLCGLCTRACGGPGADGDADCAADGLPSGRCVAAATCAEGRGVCGLVCDATAPCAEGRVCRGGVCVLAAPEPPPALDAGIDASEPPSCVPTELGLTLSPPLTGDVSGSLAAPVTVTPDRLIVTVAAFDAPEGQAPTTHTITGPFGALDPAALEGLDRVQLGSDAQTGDFRLWLWGCGRPELIVLRGGTALLTPRTGPPDEHFGAPCGGGACPSQYTLRTGSEASALSVPPGGQATDLLHTYIVGRVEGCAGVADAPARVEYVALPRSEMPACPDPAGFGGLWSAAFTLTDDAGQRFYASNDGGEIDVTVPVLVEPDDDPQSLRLTPIDADAPIPPLHLALAAGPPPALAAAPVLHLVDLGGWDGSVVLELSDSRGLRILAVSGSGAAPGAATAADIALEPALCLLSTEGEALAFRPPTVRRKGERDVLTGDSWGVRERADGARLDVRPTGPFIHTCTSDMPNARVSLVATWP